MGIFLFYAVTIRCNVINSAACFCASTKIRHQLELSKSLFPPLLLGSQTFSFYPCVSCWLQAERKMCKHQQGCCVLFFSRGMNKRRIFKINFLWLQVSLKRDEREFNRLQNSPTWRIMLQIIHDFETWRALFYVIMIEDCAISFPF